MIRFGFHTASRRHGRAAKRLSELCFREAQTFTACWKRVTTAETGRVLRENADNPLPAHAVIVDEASMLDILLMHALLQALKPGLRLFWSKMLTSFLPSARNLLSDLLRCGRILPWN